MAVALANTRSPLLPALCRQASAILGSNRPPETAVTGDTQRVVSVRGTSVRRELRETPPVAPPVPRATAPSSLLRGRLLLGFDLTPWADRVQLIDAEYAGPWELPVLGAVTVPTAVLIRPDGYVAWVGTEPTSDCLKR
jgi:hypothetical protein